MGNDDKPRQMLLLSAIESSESVQFLSKKELNGNFHHGLYYSNISNVVVELDGNCIPFEKALHDKLLTDDEIIFFARADAQNGFCEEMFDSIHGVSNYTYKYPELDILIINDIYETPAFGKQRISFMEISPSGTSRGPLCSFIDPDSGELIDKEDWGITFKTIDPTPTGITVECTQTGGQQLGELEMFWYLLFEENGLLPELDDCSYSSVIQPETTTSLYLDWTAYYGVLPSGNYELLLNVRDIFNNSQVHPLMQDFHDWQQYTIDFTIP